MSLSLEPDTIPQGPLQRCRDAGFQYAAFISYPHKIQSRGGQIIEALHKALEDRFLDEGGAEVFFDRQRLRPSYRWDEKLRQGVCRSAVTIAFVLRTYFESDYCRLEWGISESLEALRLKQGAGESLIIPICLSKTFPLPTEVSSLQYEEQFLEILASGRDLAAHEKWSELVNSIAARVLELIELVCDGARDWVKEEDLARSAQAKRFTWRPPPMPDAGKTVASSFPRLVVERAVERAMHDGLR